MELGATEIKAIAAVIEALEALPATIKVRGVRFDVQQRYGYETLAKVRLMGARSRYDRSIAVTDVSPA